LHEDIKGFVKAILSGKSLSGPSLPKVPTVDYAKYGEIVIEPLSRIQKISGPRLQASWINLPHVTQHDLADITEMEKERLRQKNLAKK
jgi:pyruvate dehydrogenase E2 component (dihydrolipoamide acetyltransferase)